MLSVWPIDMTSEKHACPHRHSVNTCPVNWDSECFIRTQGAQFRFHYMCERKFLRVQRDGKIARKVHSIQGKMKMLYIYIWHYRGRASQIRQMFHVTWDMYKDIEMDTFTCQQSFEVIKLNSWSCIRLYPVCMWLPWHMWLWHTGTHQQVTYMYAHTVCDVQ